MKAKRKKRKNMSGGRCVCSLGGGGSVGVCGWEVEGWEVVGVDSEVVF